MTRKHFLLIAETIKAQIEAERPTDSSGERAEQALRRLAMRFAQALATTNPGFDSERFLRACGVS